MASVERMLGVASLEPAIDALRRDLAAEGRTIGGRKALGCTGKAALTRIAALCEANAAGWGGETNDGAEVPSWQVS